MGWTSELAAMRRQLTNEVARWLANTFIVTLTARSSPLGDSDAIESSDEGVDPNAPSNEKKTQRPAARYQPWGFNGRPPKGIRGLALRLGSSNVLWLGIAPNQSYGPQNLDVGETAVYAEPGQTFVLDKNGNLIATPAGSGTVQLGGNAHPLPLWDTFETDLATVINMIAGGTVGTTGQWTPVQKAAMQNFVANLGIPGVGVATPVSYNSTKAENG